MQGIGMNAREWVAWSIGDAERRLQRAVRDGDGQEAVIQKERLNALTRVGRKLLLAAARPRRARSGPRRT